MKMLKPTLLAALLTGLAAIPTSQAAVIASYNDLSAAPTIASGNLLASATSVLYQTQGGTVITASDAQFTRADGGRISGNATVLTDGSYGNWGLPEPLISSGEPGLSSNINSGIITFSLDLSGPNSAGYSIGQIGVYSGWAGPGRTQVDVQVRYSTVSDPGTFIRWDPASNPGYSLLHETVVSTAADATGQSAAYGGPGSNAAGVSAFLQDSAGLSTAIATNVAKIQFEWQYQQNGFVGYRELTAIAVPEPSTWALLAIGLTTVMVLHRRRQA